MVMLFRRKQLSREKSQGYKIHKGKYMLSKLETGSRINRTCLKIVPICDSVDNQFPHLGQTVVEIEDSVCCF